MPLYLDHAYLDMMVLKQDAPLSLVAFIITQGPPPVSTAT